MNDYRRMKKHKVRAFYKRQGWNTISHRNRRRYWHQILFEVRQRS